MYKSSDVLAVCGTSYFARGHTWTCEEHRCLTSASLLAVRGNVAISTQLCLSRRSRRRTETQQLRSGGVFLFVLFWVFFYSKTRDVWIGNREHPSTFLPLCQPCARQVPWWQGGPFTPTFIRYVAFPQLRQFLLEFFFFQTYETFRKKKKTHNL